MKTNWTAGLVSEMLKSERQIDPNSETIKEIAEKLGTSQNSASFHVQNKMKLGLIEQVWKRNNGRIQKSYRIKRK